MPGSVTAMPCSRSAQRDIDVSLLSGTAVDAAFPVQCGRARGYEVQPAALPLSQNPSRRIAVANTSAGVSVCTLTPSVGVVETEQESADRHAQLSQRSGGSRARRSRPVLAVAQTADVFSAFTLLTSPTLLPLLMGGADRTIALWFRVSTRQSNPLTELHVSSRTSAETSWKAVPIDAADAAVVDECATGSTGTGARRRETKAISQSTLFGPLLVQPESTMSLVYSSELRGYPVTWLVGNTNSVWSLGACHAFSASEPAIRVMSAQLSNVTIAANRAVEVDAVLVYDSVAGASGGVCLCLIGPGRFRWGC